MRPPVRVRETTVLPTPEENQSNSPTTSDDAVETVDTAIDLWAAIDRLSREDRDMLAARRDDVRRSRLARRSRADLAPSLPRTEVGRRRRAV
jgi:hypothetical protein